MFECAARSDARHIQEGFGYQVPTVEPRLENQLFKAVPKAVTPMIMRSAINATSSEYSVAVAPFSEEIRSLMPATKASTETMSEVTSAPYQVPTREPRLENQLFKAVPKAVTPMMMRSAIKATRSEYSVAVAPFSEVKRSLTPATKAIIETISEVIVISFNSVK